MTLLRLDENQMRVVAPDVGGGFGAKFVMYPEEVAIAAACLKLRRPVKWIEDRREHFLAAVQERDQYWDLEVAFDDDGRLLGVRGRMIHDEGAYTPQGINLPYNASTALPGPLHPAGLRARRAGGRDQQGRDHAGARRRLSGGRVRDGARARSPSRTSSASTAPRCGAAISCRPSKMPYVTPLKTRSGSPITIDSGDFPRCQQHGARRHRLCRLSPSASATRAREGRYLGIGIGNGVKGTGRGPFESGIVRIGRSGRISVYTGAMPMGQGIKTALAQICAEQFGVAAGR